MTETKRFTRRNAMTAMAAGMATTLLPFRAHSQDYPSQPVTIIVPYGPGSYMDSVIRPFAQAFQKTLGQTIIVDNKGGANGVVGSQFAARSNPDGYTLLVGSTTTLAANAGLFKSLPYEPLTDFSPIGGIASTSMMLMVRSDFPARDLKGFLDHASKQSEPLAIGYGSSSAQVALALLSKVSDLNFMGVPYKATPQALTDLVGGQVPAAIVDVSNGVPHIQSGRLVALAISGEKRSAAAPDVPTLGEIFPGVQLVTWIGIVAPAGTPQAVLAKLSEATSKALDAPELKRQLESQSTDLAPMTASEMRERMERDRALWLGLIKEAGIEPR